MKTCEIEVAQTIVTTVKVTADSEDAALAEVDKRDFPLPPRDEWSSVKGSFEYEVLNGGEDDVLPIWVNIDREGRPMTETALCGRCECSREARSSTTEPAGTCTARD
jgi:hypothetical protein